MDRFPTETPPTGSPPVALSPRVPASCAAGRPVVRLVGAPDLYPDAVQAELGGAFRVVRVQWYGTRSAVWPPPDAVVVPRGVADRDGVLAALRASPTASAAPVVALPDSGSLAAGAYVVRVTGDTLAETRRLTVVR